MDRPEQEHVFALLVELSSLLEELGVLFTLANHTLWDAAKLGGYNGRNYETAVLVSADGLRTLKQATLPEHRELQEYTLHGCPFRYVDTNTVLLDYRYDRFGKYPCPGVEISVAEPRSEGGYRIRKPDGSTFAVPSGFFEATVPIEFEGRSFPAPADIDAFLAEYAGEQWRDAKWPFKTLKITTYMIFQRNCDARAFRAEPAVCETLTIGAFLKRLMYRKWYNKIRKPRARKVDEYGLYLKRTEDRFDLWERYYPQKDRIRSLVKDGQKAELEKLLEPLIDTTLLYHKKGMGFCVDEELLQVVLPFVKQRCDAEIADEIVKLAPSAYRQRPIEDVLRERGVDHPLLR